MPPRPRARVRLLDVDISALLADYEGGVTVKMLCHTYGIGLSRLYRILDDNHVPRRKQSRPRVALDVQRKIVADYAAGEAIARIADRHGVSTSAVSDIARRYWRHHQPVRERDELIRLVVAWVMGTRLREAIILRSEWEAQAGQ